MVVNHQHYNKSEIKMMFIRPAWNSYSGNYSIRQGVTGKNRITTRFCHKHSFIFNELYRKIGFLRFVAANRLRIPVM